MWYVTATRMDLSSRERRWHESAIRSLALAVALVLHAAFLLFLLRPALPWPSRRNPSAVTDHLLRVELLRHSKRLVASTKPVTPPAYHPLPTRSASARSSKTVVEASTAPAAPPPATTQSEFNQPLTPPAPYGNSRFARTMDETQSSGLPPLPGANFVSKVPGIVVATPPSLKNRVQALGRWLRCKNSIFKRDMSDEEMLKRGLTRMQMNQDYQVHCWP